MGEGEGFQKPEHPEIIHTWLLCVVCIEPYIFQVVFENLAIVSLMKLPISEGKEHQMAADKPALAFVSQDIMLFQWKMFSSASQPAGTSFSSLEKYIGVVIIENLVRQPTMKRCGGELMPYFS